MGLTIVRSIVERHHGLVRAENRSAGGALFTVTLPRGEAGAGG
jgi:signal transduction histidine kinase